MHDLMILVVVALVIRNLYLREEGAYDSGELLGLRSQPGVRRTLPRILSVGSLQAACWLLVGAGNPALAGETEEGVVAELQRWAQERVENGRRAQLELRFKPLVVDWRGSGLAVQAEALLEVWTKLDPSSVQAWKLTADAQFERQNFSAARASYQRAVGLVDDAESHLGVALAAWELGEIDEAETAFEEALARRPTSMVHFQWARFLLWRGQGLRSFQEFKALPLALRQQPEVAFLVARACVASMESVGPLQGTEDKTCDQQAAVTLFERAATLMPEHAEVRYGLARAYQRNGNLKAALEQMQLYRRLARHDQKKSREGGS